MVQLPDIAIIGAGSVGTAIGILASRGGAQVRAVAGGRNADKAAAQIGSDVRSCTPTQAASAGGLVLLTVPDGQIEKVCGELAAAGAFNEGAIVAHCCGALGSDVLAPARDKCRCHIGSMHPLQTFPTVEAAIEKLPGTYCFCEGDDGAVATLELLADAIGGQAVRIDPEGKILYHAGAVIACNYLAVLIEAAQRLFVQAGIEPRIAASALMPLVRAAVENIDKLGPAEALTGPIARGDEKTVASHVQALENCDTELAKLYKAAGMVTINLALKKETIDNAKAQALRKLFSDKSNTKE